MKKTIITIILLAVLMGASYYMGTRRDKDIEYVTTTIDLRDSERKKIAQDATLGWITKDSALVLGWDLADWALANQDPKINWIDSTNWIDSLRYKDSLRIETIYKTVPYFEAEDSIVTFDETKEDIRVQVSLVVKPIFFPTYRRFVTEVGLQSLTITQPVQKVSRFGLGITVGYGGGYSWQPENHTVYNSGANTVTHSHEGYYHGVQITLGFTYNFISF